MVERQTSNPKALGSIPSGAEPGAGLSSLRQLLCRCRSLVSEATLVQVQVSRLSEATLVQVQVSRL